MFINIFKLFAQNGTVGLLLGLGMKRIEERKYQRKKLEPAARNLRKWSETFWVFCFEILTGTRRQAWWKYSLEAIKHFLATLKALLLETCSTPKKGEKVVFKLLCILQRFIVRVASCFKLFSQNGRECGWKNAPPKTLTRGASNVMSSMYFSLQSQSDNTT